jgi:hypothetical protein
MLKRKIPARQVALILACLGIGLGFVTGFYLVPRGSRGVYLVCVFSLYLVVHVALTVLSARAAKRRR